ncbi:MAG TPA: hypothetical protein VIT67_15315 [Povalibacter sp.]|jgi:hypothetical protein
MKAVSAVLVACGLCACSTTSGPTTSWGKLGVTMTDYRIDGGQCAVIAGSAHPNGNDPRLAGGISGSNPEVPKGGAGAAAAAAGPAGGGGTGGLPTGGSMYREQASSDFVSRAAQQQRAQELNEQRARTELLKECLTQRGYKEFRLTPEQRKHLETLPQGSEERRNYLYKLGTDPAILATAGT